MRHRLPNLMKITVDESASAAISANVNITFCSPTLVTHGVSAKTKMVEMTLRVNVTPTTASAMIYQRVSGGL